jgi:hypothetical protein
MHLLRATETPLVPRTGFRGDREAQLKKTAISKSGIGWI